MSERSEIRNAIRELRNSTDPSLRQVTIAILRRYVAKVLAKYGDVSQITANNPATIITDEERRDVSLTLAIANALTRSDLVAMGLVKLEVDCETKSLFASTDTEGEGQPVTIDAENFRRLEQVLTEQVNRAKTPEQIRALREVYEHAAESAGIPGAGEKLQVFRGSERT